MVIALVLAGGSGTRMGLNIPKQYIKVNGKMIIAYCLGTLLAHENIDAVQIVAAEKRRKEILDDLGACIGHDNKFRGFSAPGRTRQLSILNGLEDIKNYASNSDYIMICDAARPLVSPSLIADCINAVKNHDGAIPVLPMKDTVYFSENGTRISSLLDRGKIYAGQAPEIFIFGKYYEANKSLLPGDILKINGSTEPAIMAGMDIAMILGDEGNFKITTRADLERFRETVEKSLSDKNKEPTAK